MDSNNLNTQTPPATQVPPVSPVQPVQPVKAMPQQPQQPVAAASTPHTPTPTPHKPSSLDPKILLAAAVILVLIILGYWAYKQFGTPVSDTAVEAGEFIPVKVGENIPPAGRLPIGFPVDIPVELEKVTEAYARTYTDRGVTQYTVVYKSSDSMADKFAEYEAYMASAGYVSSGNASSTAQDFLSGTKDNNDLSVALSMNGTDTVVNLTYLGRE